MRWVGPNGLRLNDGTFVLHGAEVPAGALSPEQARVFIEAGWLVEANQAEEAQLPIESAVPSVRVRAAKAEPKPESNPKPKRKRGRPRKKKAK